MANENKIQVDARYTASTSTDVELPNGKTLADISDFHIKWGTIYITFKDGTEFESAETDDNLIDIDTKRPSGVEIVPILDNGQPDYDNSIS